MKTTNTISKTDIILNALINSFEKKLDTTKLSERIRTHTTELISTLETMKIGSESIDFNNYKKKIVSKISILKVLYQICIDIKNNLALYRNNNKLIPYSPESNKIEPLERYIGNTIQDFRIILESFKDIDNIEIGNDEKSKIRPLVEKYLFDIRKSKAINDISDQIKFFEASLKKL